MYKVYIMSQYQPKDPECPYPTWVPQRAHGNLGISLRNSVLCVKCPPKYPKCPYPTEVPQVRQTNLGISSRYSVMRTL